MKPLRGFSLIELMVVVAIIGILMAVGLPTFSTWLRNVQIRNGAESVMNGMQLARAEALKRNERVTFWLVSLTNPRVMDSACALSAVSTSWVVSRDNPAGACEIAPSDTTAPRIIEAKPGGDGSLKVTMAATDAGGAAASCITFNGFGRVETTCTNGASPIASAALTTSEGDANTRAFSVVVSSGGAIRMCDPNVSSASDPRKC